MAEGHESAFIWLSAIALLMLITFFVTIFWVRNANTEASVHRSNQDLYAIGYDILRELSGTQGMPDDWIKHNTGYMPGILDEGYEIDMKKIEALFNIPKDYFKKIYNLNGMDYDLKLLNNSLIINSFNSTIPENFYTAKVNRELNTDLTLQILIWELNQTVS